MCARKRAFCIDDAGEPARRDFLRAKELEDALRGHRQRERAKWPAVAGDIKDGNVDCCLMSSHGADLLGQAKLAADVILRGPALAEPASFGRVVIPPEHHPVKIVR